MHCGKEDPWESENGQEVSWGLTGKRIKRPMASSSSHKGKQSTATTSQASGEPPTQEMLMTGDYALTELTQ